MYVDFVLEQYRLDDGSLWPPVSAERLEIKKLDENSGEVVQVPIFATGFSLGDVISLDGNHEVLQRSGNSTVRIRSITDNPAEIHATVDLIEKLGGTFVINDDVRVIAINIPNNEALPAILAILLESRNDGIIDYELGHWYPDSVADVSGL